jgi:hypothetical protein
VKITPPIQARAQVWDLHTREKLCEINPGEMFQFTLGKTTSHLFYVGNKYASAIP